MLFNSLLFLLFLPIVFIFYWFVFNHNLRLQNTFIVAASYVFYGLWDWHFLLLIALTSLFSWASGIAIQNWEKRKKVVLWSNMFLNIGILGIFKYYNFFVESFIDVFSVCGITLQARTLNIILPVGISFYTFQALSYSIDVYKKKVNATSDIITFFAYVSFFPQLVAGPIERATNLLPQMMSKRHFNYNQAADGCKQMLWGFFKKVVIADNCAIYVNQVFDNYQYENGSTLLMAAILFSFQIYGDFSGYSDIAIGTSKLFGIQLMQNFRYPYFSRDIAEFWRKWHISLTTWFRDYIYIPLGGSRTTQVKILRNTFIIFLVSGFWHGANWTFVAWGAYHACLFLPLILMKKNRKYTNVVAENRILPNFTESIQMLTTFLLVVIGWIIFRAKNITLAWEYICCLFSQNLFSLPHVFIGTKRTLFTLSIMLMVEWFNRNKLYGLENLGKYNVVKYCIIYFIIFIILEFGVQSQSFIYFQF